MQSYYSKWQKVDSIPELRENEVHVWRVMLSGGSPNIATLLEHLSEEEIARAERLRRHGDRLRFVTARARLREIIGSYSGISPRDIRIGKHERGKPFIAHPEGKHPEFNISHSGRLILMAFTRNRQIGIDVERYRNLNNAAKIMKRFFSREEADYYLNCSENMKDSRFFKLWTAREAYVKAVGKGAALMRKEIPVSLLADGRQRTLQTNDKNPDNWYFFNLDASPEYEAALAVQGEGFVTMFMEL